MAAMKVALIAAALMFCACGSASAVAVISPTAVATPSVSPSPAPSPSPSISPGKAVYAAHLTFSGGISGTTTTVRVDGSNKCAPGSLTLTVLLNKKAWQVSVSVDGYSGPATYKNANVFIIAPNGDFWMAPVTTATFASDTSLTVDASIDNLFAGPGEPGSRARVRGTMAC